MNADVHTILYGLNEEGRGKGAVHHGDHSRKGLPQLTEGLKIKNRHGGVCRGLSIENLCSHCVCVCVCLESLPVKEGGS